ncbi:MAG: hypothetical protein LE169_02915 [Endomicrobium sp.]|nr:hypothetical protein [Endomicrobium sp.]
MKKVISLFLMAVLISGCNRRTDNLIADGYRTCYYIYQDSISLVWCFFKRINRCWGYYDFETDKLIKETPVANDYLIDRKPIFCYKPEPVSSPIGA